MVVLEVQAKGANPQLADALTDSLLQELRNSGAVGKLVGTKELQTTVGLEAQKQLLQCDSDGCMAELAGSLGADFLLSSSLGRVGEYYTLNLKLVSTRSGQLVASSSATVCAAREGELLNALPAAARILLGRAKLLPAAQAPQPIRVSCEPAAPPASNAPPPGQGASTPDYGNDASGTSALPRILAVAGAGLLAGAALPLAVAVLGAGLAVLAWAGANAVGPIGGSYLALSVANLGGWSTAGIGGAVHVLLVVVGGAVLGVGLLAGVLS